jgi:hypothetical protein
MTRGVFSVTPGIGDEEGCEIGVRLSERERV